MITPGDRGALEALETTDLVVAHVKPRTSRHDGSVKDKIEAIERIDSEMVAVLRPLGPERLRVLVAPDHPTPIEVQTHVADMVPFVMWGSGVASNGASRLTEREGQRTGLVVDPGHRLMAQFTS